MAEAADRPGVDVDGDLRQMGEVAEGFVEDLAVSAKGPPQQVGLVDLAVVAANDCGYMNRTMSRWHAMNMRY